jgi:hypothetical protein
LIAALIAEFGPFSVVEMTIRTLHTQCPSEKDAARAVQRGNALTFPGLPVRVRAEGPFYRFNIRAPGHTKIYPSCGLFCGALCAEIVHDVGEGKCVYPAKTLKKYGLQKQYWKNVDKMWMKTPYCPCRPGT